MSKYCCVCHKSDYELNYMNMNRVCESCLAKMEERQPDATGKLIAEFLNDLYGFRETNTFVSYWYNVIKKWEERAK